MKLLTKISSSKSFDKSLRKQPNFIKEKAGAWIFLVQTQGIWNVMRIAGYHDEPLAGTRAGQRSIRLNKAYRLIYRVILDRVHLELLEITKHDY